MEIVNIGYVLKKAVLLKENNLIIENQDSQSGKS